ncbi:MAG: prolipoprotein diacylglyceryl transferase [Clostridia bacterium]|nr:prolipoprotein diacylglyceryl transferase [Clostridia bacterium]
MTERITTISFPGLGIDSFNVGSVAFSVFGRNIAWYALIITFGIVCAFAYIWWRCREIDVNFDKLIDIGLPTVFFGILGARLFYVLTTLREGGYESIVDVFAIWEGGLAIYGGLIAGALTVIVMTRLKRVPFMKFADCACPSLVLAQAIGRWGNFMNGEAFGAETDIFCRMGIRNVLTGFQTIYVHPTFLYESLWNILGFTLINLFYRHRKYDGQIFHLTFAWYGFGRMFIEILRSDSLYISSHHAWYTKISVLIGFGFFVGCTAYMIYKLLRIRHGKEQGR